MALSPASTRIVIAGAGSVGCYAGGCLARAGRHVTLLARPRLAGPIVQHGLEISDLSGLRARVAASDLRVATEPTAAFENADLIIVTVKCFDSEAMGALIARHAPAHAVVVSLQNGAGNAERLSALLPPGRRASAGMVPFNILQVLPAGGAPRFHRGVSGTAIVSAAVDGLAALIDCPGFPAAAHARVDDVLWSKLLINLNNALNALSGLPLRREFSERAWRRLLARQMREAQRVLAAEGVALAPIEGIHPRFLPFLLCLPDAIFKRIAGTMLAIDPEARSSMWEDLERRRPTEIDYLQGAILSLAARHGIETPQIARVHALIKTAERAAFGSPALPARTIELPVQTVAQP